MEMLKSLALVALLAPMAQATPVEVQWGAGETLPVKVARPFGGFLPDGAFLVAGGSDFVDGVKVYGDSVCVRSGDASSPSRWTVVGRLPHRVAEGVSCEVPTGVFCAGGTDGETDYADAYIFDPQIPAPAPGGATPSSPHSQPAR